MSLTTFERRVQPHIRVTVTGSLVLVTPGELERWAREHSRAPIA